MEILSISPLDLSTYSLAEKLHADEETVERLVQSLTDAMDAKAAFQASYLDHKGDDAVTVDSVRFKSRVMARNLSDVGRVFPFVLTLGAAADKVIDDQTNILDKYLLDEIGNVALRESRIQLESHLKRKFALETISYMSPGSLTDWPIEEQKSLFAVLVGVESAIGVRLTESYLMIPRKSVSGVYFPSEVSFYSCQLCPRKRCDHRKAPFDRSKAREYGVKGPP